MFSKANVGIFNVLLVTKISCLRWGGMESRREYLCKARILTSVKPLDVYHPDHWFWFIHSLHSIMPRTGSSLQCVCHKLDFSGLLSCTLVTLLCLIGLGFANKQWQGWYLCMMASGIPNLITSSFNAQQNILACMRSTSLSTPFSKMNNYWTLEPGLRFCC